MSKSNPTPTEVKAMKAELKRIKAFIKKNSDDGSTPSINTGYARVIGFRNDKNSEEYNKEYTYMEFVDSANNAIGSPYGDEEATAVLKEIKKIRYGTNKRGKAQFDKVVKAWSIQTEYVPAFVVMGTKSAKGVFKASK